MWQMMSIKETVERLKTNIETGLSDEDIIKRKEEYGLNELNDNKKESIFVKYIKQFSDFMIIVLIIAAIISAIISCLDGTNKYLDSVIIIFIVALNALMGVVQEAKAEKSLEALKKMVAPTTKVKRNGEIISISSVNIVPGDLIIIEAGSYVPADARIIKSYNLKIDESALTGETTPILKNEKVKLKENIPIGDMVNMAFGATIAVSRTCRSNSNKYRNGYKGRKNSNFNNIR